MTKAEMTQISERYWDFDLSAEEREAVEKQMFANKALAAEVEREKALRDALSNLLVPKMSPGFAARAIHNAVQSHGKESRPNAEQGAFAV